MEKEGIDAIVLPSNGNVAFKHTYGAKLDLSNSYTFVINMLDFPAGIVPVTTVK